jgi:hypothetical protein
VPQLVPLVSPSEQASRNREIDELLQRTEESLSKVSNHKLDERQQLDVGRARTFIRQAQDLRNTDPVGARNIAQRAALLAESVVRSLR